MYDSQTNQEISWRNKARLNDVFPQERGDYLWDKKERKWLSKITSKKLNETVATKHCAINKIKIRKLTGPPPKMIVPFIKVESISRSLIE